MVAAFVDGRNDIGLPLSPLRQVSVAEIAAYNTHGAWPVRNILPPEWIAFMQDSVDRVLSKPTPLAQDYQAAPGTGRFFGDVFTYRFDAAFRRFALDSPLAEIISQIWPDTTIRFFYDQLLVKEPETVEPTPWHNDLPYWPVRGERIISLWIPLDPAGPENGVVRYVSGSHAWGTHYNPATFSFRDGPRQVTQAMAESWTPGNLPEVPDIDADPDKYVQLTWELEPGDLVLHHPLTVHGAPGNASRTKRRRAIAMRFVGDGVCFVSNGKSMFDAVSPIFGDVGLENGAPVSGDHFPVAWPRG